MKLKTIGLLLIVCLSSVSYGYSEGKEAPKTQSPTKSGVGLLKTLGSSSDKKRLPSQNIVELYYENGILTMTSQTQERIFSMQFLNVMGGNSNLDIRHI